MGALPAPATTISWPESTLTAQTTTTILSQRATPRPDTNLPLERWCAHQEGKQTQAHAQPPSDE
jgi:hypothetical protein